MEDFTNTLSGWGNSISQGFSDLWQKTKEVTSNVTNTNDSTSSPSNSSSNYTANYGGKKTKKRHMKGGYVSYSPKNNIASHASSFSGITAKPHTYVGGKNKRKHKKTRKN